MEWKRGQNTHYIKSDEGYYVARTIHRGVAKFSPFTPTGERISGPTLDPDEARAICDEHANT